eukprot:TRINITY_DN3306_c0_g2_i1.p2 TRINITY_DN3306_c0_g2~~TRINITY_DN3306_c0_g2_i1.p2  ORF type:complete len:242 (-),score=70.47 TRINITY_DN3306_c0_g2_i1:53-778(-)
MTAAAAAVSAAAAARAAAAVACAFDPVPRCTSLFRDFCFTTNILDSGRFKRLLADPEHGGILWNVFENYASSPESFHLSAAGRHMLNTPNAGGNSIWSEVISYEIFATAFRAKLLHTETEIEYAMDGKITDYSMMIDDRNIGVSVTRLIDFRDLDYAKYNPALTATEVRRLLHKKMYGVIASSKLVLKRHRWEKQILHVLTTSRSAAREVFAQYWQLPQPLLANTVVVVTECNRASWLFVK